MYKQSFYNIMETNSEGRVVLFNIRTGGIVVPNNVENNKFIEILNKPDNFPDDDLLKAELIKYNFLINSDFDELDIIKKFHEKSINKPSPSIQCTIIPTKLCNFDCTYCYIKEHENTIMNEMVYSKIYKYITQKIIIAKEKFKNEKIQLRIEWFGGEPTLESEKILDFMEKLIFLAKTQDIEIISSMVTNGYLLNYKLFEKFVFKKITNFQITLDGNKNTHDQNRYLKNKQETFDKIYNNLLEIQKKTPTDMDYKINIRTNIMKSNIGEMELFRKQIKEDFKDKRITHYFSHVYQYNNENKIIISHLFSNDEGLGQSYSLNIANIFQKFKDYAISEMYKGLPRPKASNCMVHSDIYTILPNGKVTACMAAVDECDSVGILEEDGSISFNDACKLWKKSIFQDKNVFNDCYKCKLLPICMGGCKYSFFCNSLIRCETIEDNVRGMLILYLKEYLNKSEKEEKEMTIYGIVVDGDKKNEVKDTISNSEDRRVLLHTSLIPSCSN